MLVWWLLAPVGAEVVLLILAITVSPDWTSAIMGGLLVLVMIGLSLLYRNWPTGIRVDESGITIGAIRSRRARTRKPSVFRQSWSVHLPVAVRA